MFKTSFIKSSFQCVKLNNTNQINLYTEFAFKWNGVCLFSSILLLSAIQFIFLSHVCTSSRDACASPNEHEFQFAFVF